MQYGASEILQTLSDAPAISVEPGLVVESRVSHGIHGEDADLALSVEWRDAEGCLWAADFTESALARAEITGGVVSVRDVDGAKVVFQLFKPSKRIRLTPIENDR